MTDQSITIEVGDPEFQIWSTNPEFKLLAEAVGGRGPRGFVGPSLSFELGMSPYELIDQEVRAPVAAVVATVGPVLAQATEDVDDLITATGEAFSQSQAAIDTHLAGKDAEIGAHLTAVTDFVAGAQGVIASKLPTSIVLRGTNARSAIEKFNDQFNLLDYRYAATDGTASASTAINAALAFAAAEGLGKLYLPGGTLLIGDTIIPLSGVAIVGRAKSATTLRLQSGANQTVIASTALVEDFTIADMTIDGNKAGQTPGVTSRAVNLSDARRFRADRIRIRNINDHGFNVSSQADGSGDNLLTDCEAWDVGSQAHLDAGGVGGTGFLVGDSLQTRNIARRCFLNGFKGGRNFLDCEVYDTVYGGGFEMGVTGSYQFYRYIGCKVFAARGGAWRDVGSADDVELISCVAESCGASAITIVNSVKRFVINGGTWRGNGFLATRSATVGKDGMTILNTTGIPDEIIITGGAKFSENAEYGIANKSTAGGSLDIVHATFAGNGIAPVNFPVASSEITVGQNVRGYPLNLCDRTTVAVAAVTTADLKRLTVPAGTLHAGSRIEIVASGDVSGAAGTKIIRFGIDTSTVVLSNQLATEAQEWFARITMIPVSPTRIMLLVTGAEEGGQVTSAVIDLTVNHYNSPFDIYFQTSVGGAGDQVRLELFDCITLR